jgi:predicted transcriptional regulator
MKKTVGVQWELRDAMAPSRGTVIAPCRAAMGIAARPGAQRLAFRPCAQFGARTSSPKAAQPGAALHC